MKKFINHLMHSMWQVPISKLTLLHQRLGKPIEEDSEPKKLSPYSVFLGWMLDLSVYGMMLTYIYHWYVSFRGFWLADILAFGLGSWLVIDTVSRLKEALGK